MQTILRGSIKGNAPVLNAKINKNKTLEFTSKGKLPLVVDTGFTDGIALPKQIIKKLRTEFVGYESFILADGTSVKAKVFLGFVKVGNYNIATTFIEGDHLIGMEFMASIANELKIDLKKKTVELLK